MLGTQQQQQFFAFNEPSSSTKYIAPYMLDLDKTAVKPSSQYYPSSEWSAPSDGQDNSFEEPSTTLIPQDAMLKGISEEIYGAPSNRTPFGDFTGSDEYNSLLYVNPNTDEDDDMSVPYDDVPEAMEEDDDEDDEEFDDDWMEQDYDNLDQLDYFSMMNDQYGGNHPNMKSLQNQSPHSANLPFFKSNGVLTFDDGYDYQPQTQQPLQQRSKQQPQSLESQQPPVLENRNFNEAYDLMRQPVNVVEEESAIAARAKKNTDSDLQANLRQMSFDSVSSVHDSSDDEEFVLNAPTAKPLSSSSNAKSRKPRGSTQKRKSASTSSSSSHLCELVNPSTGQICGKLFSRPYDLVRHQDTIHAAVRKTFKCELCPNGTKTFSRMDALSRHMRVKHGDN